MILNGTAWVEAIDSHSNSGKPASARPAPYTPRPRRLLRGSRRRGAHVRLRSSCRVPSAVPCTHRRCRIASRDTRQRMPALVVDAERQRSAAGADNVPPRRPTLPELSRNATRSSPRRRTRTGAPPGSATSLASKAGNQNRRTSWPIRVSGPTRVSNSLSAAESMSVSPRECPTAGDRQTGSGASRDVRGQTRRRHRPN